MQTIVANIVRLAQIGYLMQLDMSVVELFAIPLTKFVRFVIIELGNFADFEFISYAVIIRELFLRLLTMLDLHVNRIAFEHASIMARRVLDHFQEGTILAHDANELFVRVVLCVQLTNGARGHVSEVFRLKAPRQRARSCYIQQ